MARPCDRVASLILLKISAASGGFWVGFIIIDSVVLIYLYYLCKSIKKPGFFTCICYQGEELPGLRCKFSNYMAYNKQFFNKVFSDKRMERYFSLYPDNENKAIEHYQCNLRLSEAMYVPLSVFEVTLRNALCRELSAMAGREDWYAIFPDAAPATVVVAGSWGGVSFLYCPVEEVCDECLVVLECVFYWLRKSFYVFAEHVDAACVVLEY